ncbi:flagellar basal body P-ring formation chaperone FlgA [Azoarcus olearius]|uniref:Chaperon for flagellar basal body P-ring formation n=1 Tax=Azoarcus sp. (strain BH72) TaxID=418699 RepID=A1K952_AZOSB|nr:flagellar basal body P-ring formation chaperone FlgA [Azoarcus olearius]CAL95357.1 chaperon for flagellar basal body P-ring formation [Azoarcus olearius]
MKRTRLPARPPCRRGPAALSAFLRPAAFARLPFTLLAAAGALLAGNVSAQQPAAPVTAAVIRFLEQEARGLPGRVAVSVTPLDARNQLPPCMSLVPFLPAGTRAWGQISVGVRCDSPVEWTAYLQARVSVLGEYLVTAQPLRAGQIIGPADLVRRDGDLATLPDNTLTDVAQASGQYTRFAIAQGSPLRADMLRIPPAVRQGQTVQVVTVGSGFRVSSEGVALNNGAPGDPVRVRLGGGQVVTGAARAGGVVEVTP